MSAAKHSVNLLPEELIQEVLLRLRRKSLLRCRCVSKGLRNLIDFPIFKKRYDVFHNSVSDFKVMIIEDDRLFSMDFHLPDNLNSSMEKEVSIPHKKNPRFIGSCKGIVCLMISPALMFSPAHESYILLNPFNRTYQKVKCSNLYPLNWNFAIGFGYDYAKDDYKIVRLEPVEHGTTVRYLDVYSMRRDSWTQVVGEFSPGCSNHVNGICVEGAIHWLWLNKKDGYSCIAAFDLETETLRSLPLPPQLIEVRQLWRLRDLGGRLCVIVKSPSGSTTIVWVMKEYGIETSWTRLFNIVNDITFVVGYFPLWDSARLLCLGSDSRTLLWLNTQDGSKEDIQILKLPRQQLSQQINDQIWNETKSWVCVRSPLRLRCSESQND